MIKNTILLFILSLSIATIDCEAKKVLFIGNSYTSQCSDTITKLFKNESPDWKLTFHTKGGKDFAYHLAEPATEKLIRSQKWDFVILQEQSQKSGLGGKSSQGFHNDVASFSKIIRDTGSTPCLYLTWGRKAGDKKNPKIYPNYQAMQKKISTAYLKRGKITRHVFSRSVSLIQKSNSKTKHSLKACIKKMEAILLQLEPMLSPLFFGVA
jgi:hypothetical protein